MQIFNLKSLITDVAQYGMNTSLSINIEDNFATLHTLTDDFFPLLQSIKGDLRSHARAEGKQLLKLRAKHDRLMKLIKSHADDFSMEKYKASLEKLQASIIKNSDKNKESCGSI